MSRRNRPRKAAGNLSDLEWAYLCDAADEFPPSKERWALDAGIRAFVPKTAEELWHEHGADVLDWWIVERPGTRPSLWWRFAAPEPRRRLGGGGNAYGEHGPHCDRRLGVPANWNSYPGNVPIDPNDPPVFESQAAFLDRLGLLLPGERKRLGKVDFEPEPVTAIFDFAEAVA